MKQNIEQKVEDKNVSPTCGKPLVMGSTVFNEDCMTVMARYPDKYFDLAIVDPPYGINRAGQIETITKNPIHKRKYYEDKGWDNERPDKKYW